MALWRSTVVRVALLNLFVFLFSSLAIILGAELWARIDPNPTMIERNWAKNLSPDTTLGFRLVPNSVAEESATIGDKSLYDVSYTISADGWRVVPRTAPTLETNQAFLAVFGGSIAFGLGVQDDETISANLASDFPGRTPYLFAAMGYGAGNIYELVRNGLQETIRESSGIGLYVLFTGHLNRVEGTLRTAKWAEQFPYYRLDDAGKLRHYASLQEVAPFKKQLFSLLNKSQFLSRVQFNWPNNQAWERPKTVAITAALIVATAESFSKQFPGSPYYVLFYPRPDSRELAAALCPFLDHAGVPYICMHGILDGLPATEQTVDGGHPTAIANKIVADEIARQLKATSEDRQPLPK